MFVKPLSHSLELRVKRDKTTALDWDFKVRDLWVHPLNASPGGSVPSHLRYALVFQKQNKMNSKEKSNLS